MTGFATPPSTTDSTMYYGSTFIRLNGTGIIPVLVPYCFTIKQEHTWTSEQVQNVCNVLNLKIPNTSTIEDVTYTANMAYADFYPELLNEHQCIKYAVAVANDKDGYTGIQFCRWVADVVGKKENIDWDKFK